MKSLLHTASKLPSAIISNSYSTKNNSDKFNDPLYKSLRMMVFRIVNDLTSPHLSGPATFAPGLPILTYKAGFVGVVAFDPIDGMEAYLNNASSNFSNKDDSQHLMTIPALMHLYYKAAALENNLLPKHNELQIKDKKPRDRTWFIKTLEDLEEAKSYVKKHRDVVGNDDISLYDEKSGGFYYILNGKKADLIVPPRDILSYHNILHNQDMAAFIKREYHKEIHRLAKNLAENNHGVFPDDFMNTNKIAQIFREDVKKIIDKGFGFSPDQFSKLNNPNHRSL